MTREGLYLHLGSLKRTYESTTPYYESTTRLLGKKGYSACAHFFSLSIMSRAMRGVMPVCSSTSTPT